MKKLVFIFLLFSSALFSQADYADSVKTILSSEAHDTDKVIVLNKTAWGLINTAEFKSAIQCLDASEEIATRKKFKNHLARATVFKGIAYRMQGEFKDAITYLSKGLAMTEEIGNYKGQATCLGNLGIIYEIQNNYKKAFEYYSKALEIRTQMNDKEGMIFSYNDIAILFDSQRDFKNSLTYFYKALAISEEIGDTAKMALCWNSLANSNMGVHNFSKAEEFANKALNYYSHTQDKDNMCRIFCILGEVEKYKQNYKKAIDYFERSYEMADAINVREVKRDASSGLASVYFETKDFEKAFKAQWNYIAAKDSILNSQTTRQMAEMNSKYESEKKDKEILLHKAETEKQLIVKNAFILGFGVLLILVIFVFRSYIQKKKDNKIIQLQKAIVEEKQKEILDSIQYAKRIQTALMSNERHIDNTLQRLMKN